MKTHIEYECEICHCRYRSKEHALECEADGVPNGFEKGIMFGDHSKGAFYAGITFATAKNRIDGHHNHLGSWACRDKHGDSLGDETCGGANSYRSDLLHESDGNLDPSHPTFKRMRAWLESQGITPLVWNGNTVVAVDEYVEARRVAGAGDDVELRYDD